MKYLKLLSFTLMTMSVVTQANECDKNFTSNALATFKASNFVIDNEQKRNETALQLLTCIGHDDPKIRDGVVFEAYSHWLRKELLETKTITSLFESLANNLVTKNTDKTNFTLPFTALILAEVVRVDRIKPYLTDVQRQRAIDVTTQYLYSINDYRGFDDKEGWRHSVAHTADVFLQLSLNKQINKMQFNAMIDAIQHQVSPSNHFYHYGEPKRLAMPFIYMVYKGLHSKDEIAAIINKIASPAPFKSWGDVYQSNKGLAKLHNTRSFLYSIFVITSTSKNEHLQAMQPALLTAIKSLG